MGRIQGSDCAARRRLSPTRTRAPLALARALSLSFSLSLSLSPVPSSNYYCDPSRLLEEGELPHHDEERARGH